jgi:methyl-accepting chemotaxis protein
MAWIDRTVATDRDGPAVETASDRTRPRFRRRSILVRRRYQLRAAVLVTAVALVLLVFLNLALYSASAARTDRLLTESPELARYVESQDRVLVLLVVLGSSVFLVGVFLVSLLETHKTAGACVNLARRLQEIESGRYDTELRLRRDDHLRDLEPAFNRMCRELQQRTWDDVETLESIASRLERSGGAVDASAVAVELRRLAAAHRSRIE